MRPRTTGRGCFHPSRPLPFAAPARQPRAHRAGRCLRAGRRRAVGARRPPGHRRGNHRRPPRSRPMAGRVGSRHGQRRPGLERTPLARPPHRGRTHPRPSTRSPRSRRRPALPLTALHLQGRPRRPGVVCPLARSGCPGAPHPGRHTRPQPAARRLPRHRRSVGRPHGGHRTRAARPRRPFCRLLAGARPRAA